MLFTEFRFVIFFAALFLIYWCLPGNRDRKIFLVLASYFFYAAWDYRFLSLIILSTLTDYIVGQKIAATDQQARKKLWLLISLVVNLGLLATFKYLNFFVDSFVDFANLMGLPVSDVTLSIVLPVGISFYTFQTLSYTIDIYRDRIKPTTSLTDFALFVAFFPQLVAGPIVRAKDFLPQLDKKRLLSSVDFRWALVLFLVGYTKKAVVADNLAIFADAFYASPELYGTAQAWIGIISYMAQIFCDFSGYSDMAIGLAGMLGYRLRPNFDTPYVTADITTFWKRWHMSLSSWLRDYVLVSLERANSARQAGNRIGNWLSYRNLMLTFLLAGLWHGAAWTFVIWGGLQGLGLLAHRYWRETTDYRVSFWVGLAVTQIYLCVTLVMFRATSLDNAASVYASLTNFSEPLLGSLSPAETALYFAAIVGLYLMHYARRADWFVQFWRHTPAIPFAAAYGAAFALAVSCRVIGYQPFIYFQF